jgi:hypothetical protein
VNFSWSWCVNVNSSAILTEPLWRGMLVIGEFKHIWGHVVYGKSLYFPHNFTFKSIFFNSVSPSGHICVHHYLSITNCKGSQVSLLREFRSHITQTIEQRLRENLCIRTCCGLKEKWKRCLKKEHFTNSQLF